MSANCLPPAPPPPPGPRIVREGFIPRAPAHPAGHRTPTAAPPLSIELAIVLGVAFAGIVVHALPDMRAWARGEAPVGIHAPLEKCRGEAARHVTLAARYAAVIVGCLNGGAITDGEQIVACRKPR